MEIWIPKAAISSIFLSNNSDACSILSPEMKSFSKAEIAIETQKFVYETASRMDSDFLVALSEAGVEVNEPDREAFEAASREIYEDFSSSVVGAGELVRQSLELEENSGL